MTEEKLPERYLYLYMFGAEAPEPETPIRPIEDPMVVLRGRMVDRLNAHLPGNEARIVEGVEDALDAVGAYLREQYDRMELYLAFRALVLAAPTPDDTTALMRAVPNSILEAVTGQWTKTILEGFKDEALPTLSGVEVLLAAEYLRRKTNTEYTVMVRDQRQWVTTTCRGEVTETAIGAPTHPDESSSQFLQSKLATLPADGTDRV